MDFGVASFVAIVVIAYLIGQAIKLIPAIPNEAIPVICGFAGGILGVVAFYLGIPDFPATDVLTAIAVGITSGLSATGVNQAVKQLSGSYKTEE